MDRKDMMRVETYLRDTFRNEAINLRPRANLKDSVEVYLGSDFLGVVSERGSPIQFPPPPRFISRSGFL